MNNKFSPIARALGFATMAHHGQFDKAEKPYILHPMAVADSINGQTSLSTYETLYIAALLHDVIEDTPATFDDLRPFFTQEVISAVGSLTRMWAVQYDDGTSYLEYKKPIVFRPAKKEDYKNFVIRCKKNHIARIVKIADIQHNLSRMDHLPAKEQAYLRGKYEPALAFLLDETATTY